MDVAAFVNDRQVAMSKVYKQANANARILPRMSKSASASASASDAHPASEADDGDSKALTAAPRPTPDADSRPQASIDAYRAVLGIRGNVHLTRSEARQMIHILQRRAGYVPASYFAAGLIALIAVALALAIGVGSTHACRRAAPAR